MFRRLYSPTVAHTTSAKGLECGACHINSVAIGLGEGLLSIKKVSKGNLLDFQPLFEKRPEDRLPKDAWCEFLMTRKKMTSTRIGARPFSCEEQARIVRVGVCLICHQPDADGIEKIYHDFPAALTRMTPQCVLPDLLSAGLRKAEI